MLWNRRYVIKSYIRASLWVVPLVAVILHLTVSRIVSKIDYWLMETGRIDETTAFFALTVSGARSLLETVITVNLSFLVFTFGSLLVAIQVAGGQYTPRIIATTLLRDNRIRFIVGYFVFTLLFSIRLLIRMDAGVVVQFNMFVAGILGLFSLVAFLYLIDYAARFLRPVSIVQRLGTSGIAVLQHVYTESGTRSLPAESPRKHESADRTVTHEGTSGIVLAVDLAGLVAQAEQGDGIIEFVPQVGDFVAVDEPLFRLYGGATALNDRQLRGSVALGSERTLEQDPTFAFRILVDIAIKALSPAINDPTTAVLAIDQLHRLLRRVGALHSRSEEICDAGDALRLIFRTPQWEDYVNLSCTEIRHFGVGSVQIMRRMRSMLENLILTLPPLRHGALRQQLELLDRVIDEHYSLPEDRAIARIPDPQGMGGAAGV